MAFDQNEEFLILLKESYLVSVRHDNIFCVLLQKTVSKILKPSNKKIVKSNLLLMFLLFSYIDFKNYQQFYEYQSLEKLSYEQNYIHHFNTFACIINHNYHIMTIPFVFTFNIRRSLFEQYGFSLFQHIQTLNMQSGKILLLPVVNNLADGVQKRAKTLSSLLQNLLKMNQVQKCHLISYSLSGVDARFAIANHKVDQYVQTLTTIASPHRGSKLAWLSERQVFSDKKSEPLARLLGVGLRPFWEVSPENMIHYNKVVKNSPSVSYFSIGAQRLPNNMNTHLMQTGNYLRQQTQKNFVYENDGIFGHDECQWGQHLVNFQADHTEVVGLNPYDQLQSVFTLIEDNATHAKQTAHQ